MHKTTKHEKGNSRNFDAIFAERSQKCPFILLAAGHITCMEFQL